ncbi:hypothetical protein [Halostella pelagica]|uniref:hypothetical protein n=1 Tax=Halostella pelagica TaxID=2583824 RepID=UPI0010801770|nr:hypothetical protein [Halostella pelagica]
MAKEIPILTGLMARLVKLIAGTAFLLVGGVMVLSGLGDMGVVDNVLLAAAGALVASVGVYAYYLAYTDDTIYLRLGSKHR